MTNTILRVPYCNSSIPGQNPIVIIKAPMLHDVSFTACPAVRRLPGRVGSNMCVENSSPKPDITPDLGEDLRSRSLNLGPGLPKGTFF